MNLTRREALAGTTVVAASAAASAALAGWEPNERYPDPAIKVLDASFRKYRTQHRWHGASRHRHALERRADLVRRWALPALERHAQ
jgi:hypothetical protein